MKILLPLDGSELSESVIPCVAGLAQRWGAQVVLVRAIDPFTAAAPALQPSLALRLQERSMSAAEESMANLETRFGEVPVQSLCAVGSPSDEIAQTAAREECQLIVMASHGRTGPARWLLGSVAEGVLRQTRCPILLLRPAPTQVSIFHNILVPVDGSEASQRVVHSLAPYLADGGKVTMLRTSGTTLYNSAIEIKSDDVQDYLDGLEKELRTIQVEGIDLKVKVVDGEAAEAILAFAKDQGCDLIAMSTHGRSGFRRFWLGSVTEKVARNAACPVLAFPGAESSDK